MSLPRQTVKGIAGELAPEQAFPAAAPVLGERDMGPTLPAGTMVGDYRIDHKLADGGMASVYMATHPVIQKRVAVKVMMPALCRDVVAVERFLQEARAVNQIGHANIVDVFALGQLPDGRNYLVMELLSGQSLAERMLKGRLSLVESLEILDQVVDALEAAHEKGIIHRDLKPDNIFVEAGRKGHLRVKLFDFGILKLMDSKQEQPGRTPRQTHDRLIIGTPYYMAPEQARGEEVDAAADIYSFGVMAYEMVLGRLPFDADNGLSLLVLHLHQEPPAPRSLWPEIPPALETLLLAMLAKEPVARPTLAEVRSGIAEVRATLPVEAFADEPWVHSALRRLVPGKRRALPLAGVVAALGAMAVVAFAAGLFAPKGAARIHGLARAAVLESPRRAPSAAHPQASVAISPNVAVPLAHSPPTLRRGALVITAFPNAQIEVDGRLVAEGAASARADVEGGGEHVVVVSAPHYKTHRAVVVVGNGKSLAVSVRLVPAGAAPKPARGDDYMLDPFGK